MKTEIKLIAYCFILFVTLVSAKIVMYDIKNNTAETNQIEGLYIFTDSKPVKEFEFIGTEKITFSMSGSYEAVINKIAKKARKEFPTAQALIFDGEGQAQIIKFK